MSDTQLRAKVKKVKHPLELKKKALLELSEKEFLEDSRHFQELLELKRENAKLKERVRLLRDIVKKTVQILPEERN